MSPAPSASSSAEGAEPIALEPGTVVEVLAGTKHCHGAAADWRFSHVAIAVPGENMSNEWLEPVADDHFDALSAHPH